MCTILVKRVSLLKTIAYRQLRKFHQTVNDVQNVISDSSDDIINNNNNNINNSIGKVKNRRDVPNEKHTPNVNVLNYLKSDKVLNNVIDLIPTKYLHLKRRSVPENLYLIDNNIAIEAINLIWDDLKKTEACGLICETNAGLGLISTELLKRGIRLIRLYESCNEFRNNLRDLNNIYPNRIELFAKDFFQLHRMSYIDKLDRGNRIEQMMRGIKKKEWGSEPIMTIIGTLSTSSFMRYLNKIIALQTEVMRYGRIKLYVFMKPDDYVTCTAGPHLNLHTYQKKSVLFNWFYTCELLGKYERKRFLPWEAKRNVTHSTRYPKKIDLDYMYFVKIEIKKTLPIDTNLLLPLYYFVQQTFGKGNMRVIPTLEKWIPGCGANLIVPTKKRKHYYEEMNIYTTFGQLTPLEILSVFKEVQIHPAYQTSPFVSMIDAELLKQETIPTDISEMDIIPKHEVFQEILNE